MTVDEIIDLALKRGAKDGLAALGPVERKVWLISEAEVHCGMKGIDTFLGYYTEVLPEAADAFASIGAHEIAQSLRSIHTAGLHCPDDLLDAANQLITFRTGYGYKAIARFVSEAT